MIVPSQLLPPRSPCMVTKTPASAIKAANQTRIVVRSPSSNRARIAANRGEVAAIQDTLATGAFARERM